MESALFSTWGGGRDDIAGQEPLTSQAGPSGVPREELDHAGVRLMANLGPDHVLMLQREATGDLALHTYSTASL